MEKNKIKTDKKIIGFFERCENFLKHLRRLYYIRFKFDYILQSLEKRKGTCTYWKCGCCSTLFFPCKYYNTKTKKCTLWEKKGKKAIPLPCYIYPFDEKDKIRWAKKHGCGFYWEKN